MKREMQLAGEKNTIRKNIPVDFRLPVIGKKNVGILLKICIETIVYGSKLIMKNCPIM